MAEKPIIFSTEMVQAILNGRKTQTRRVVKPQPQMINGKFEHSGFSEDAWPEPNVYLALTPSGKFGLNKPPYYRSPYSFGDILWVRETWKRLPDKLYAYKASPETLKDKQGFQWEITDKWKPSIHMPREAARIFLEVKNVRVERVQEITVEDAIAEGWPRVQELFPLVNTEDKAIGWFRRLWDELSMKTRGSDWYTNEWVWVYDFKKVEANQ